MVKQKGRIDDWGRECTGCGVYKLWVEFSASKRGTNGYQSKCKECNMLYDVKNKNRISERNKEYRRNNRDEMNVRRRKHDLENKEHIAVRNKKYRDGHKEQTQKSNSKSYIKHRESRLKKQKEYNLNNAYKVKEQRREKRVVNQEKHRAISKEFRENNKESIAIYQKEYRKTHKEESRLYKIKYYAENKLKISEYEKTRKGDNADYKMRTILRSRLNIALKKQSSTKFNSTMDLIGCTPAECIQYLEATSKRGLKFKDVAFRGHHVDHVIPCAYFDLTDELDQLICFNYRNLQLLPWKENLSKNDTLPDFEDLKNLYCKIAMKLMGGIEFEL